MSIITGGVVHIINTVEDLLLIIDSHHTLNIYTGCDEKKNKFMRINFTLKNGKSEIKIYNNGGYCCYLDCNGDNLECMEFNDHNLTDAEGSFHKAFKDLITFDRQQAPKSNNNTSIDRASFGLAEVN